MISSFMTRWHWVHSSGSYLKANWDGVLDLQNQDTGMGGIVHDSEGVVLVSTCNNLSHSTMPIIAEALAFRRMMILCKEMGLTHLNFEGNYIMLVNAACGFGESHKAIIHYLLQTHPDWKISFAPEESNKVAHVLAKLACSLSMKLVWRETYPKQVVSFVLHDVMDSFPII